MGKYRRLAHAVYQCTHHVVWVAKYRYGILVGEVAQLIERRTRMWCEWKDVEVMELTLQPDHVHAGLSIPPKLSVSSFMGFLKGKLAIKVMKSYPYQAEHERREETERRDYDLFQRPPHARRATTALSARREIAAPGRPRSRLGRMVRRETRCSRRGG